MFFKLLILPIFLLLQFTCFAQITIDMKTGETITGFIISEDDSLIKFITEDKLSWDIPKDQIDNRDSIIYIIETVGGEKYIGAIINPPDKDYLISQKNGFIITVPKNSVYSLSKFNYGILGITFGSMGSYNLLFGYHFGDFALRCEIHGPFGGMIWGLQTNICYNISKLKSFEQNLSFGAGYCEDLENYLGSYYEKNEKIRYLGIFYDLNYWGIFLEIGLSTRKIIDFRNSSSFRYNPLSFQIGYVYSFKD